MTKKKITTDPETSSGWQKRK